MQIELWSEHVLYSEKKIIHWIGIQEPFELSLEGGRGLPGTEKPRRVL